MVSPQCVTSYVAEKLVVSWALRSTHCAGWGLGVDGVVGEMWRAAFTILGRFFFPLWTWGMRWWFFVWFLDLQFEWLSLGPCKLGSLTRSKFDKVNISTWLKTLPSPWLMSTLLYGTGKDSNIFWRLMKKKSQQKPFMIVQNTCSRALIVRRRKSQPHGQETWASSFAQTKMWPSPEVRGFSKW